MKIVIPGGTGQVGRVLARALLDRGHDVVVLSRDGSSDARVVPWDGRTLGAWTDEIDGADVVINLAGRSVNCRYTGKNLKAMMDSRVESTRAVGQAIAAARRPPRAWLQMSTATLYAHRFDAANDEATGIVGGHEPAAHPGWQRSIDIVQAWERTLAEAATPKTRKVVLRMAILMAPSSGGVLDLLLRLTRWGLGGPIAGGRQFVSWIHDRDLVRAVAFLIDHEEIDGAVNLSAPAPLTQREFMAGLREAWGKRIGLPAARWMVEIGTFFMRSESELVLKSRRVVPGRLRDAGFSFDFPDWPAAARDLVSRWRSGRRR